MRGLLVTGTDTDVGKTWFMLKLGELLKSNKIKFHFLKPVESGCESPNNQIVPNDALQYSKLENAPLEKICKYMFKAYASPPRAAKMENKSIELEDILNFIKINSDNDAFNIIEGCGGFFSPIANNKLTSDLALEIDLPVALVVKNTLGCINHSLLTITAMNSLGLNIKFIILNDISKKTPLDNYDELSNFTNIPIFRMSYNKELNKDILAHLN
jgi:dethiobiotin synthetase